MNAREIADFVGGELRGDGDVEIDSVSGIDGASSGQIAFIDEREPPETISAACVIVGHNFAIDLTIPTIRVSNPKLEFARIAAILHEPARGEAYIHSSSVISDTATLGNDVSIGAFSCVGDESTIGDDTLLREGCKIGRGVTIGRNCVLNPNVFVENGCTIGDGVILHAGVVIGADGFGYVKDTAATHPLTGGEYIKFPQIGTVVIEDNVEIGANTCVDRGALGETRIGAGTKIDNLVQVGHNVQIGKRCVIAAQTGISGSTVIEDDCVIGGQVGFGDHARVKSGAIIGSQAGVLPGKIVRAGVWWGTPVQPLEEFKRQNAHMKGLGRLKADVKELKKQVRDRSDDPSS